MMKAGIASTSHPVNDANTQPVLFKQLTVIFIDAGALFKFETQSHVLAAKPRLREY